MYNQQDAHLLAQCIDSHEEADSHMMLHLQHAAQKKYGP